MRSLNLIAAAAVTVFLLLSAESAHAKVGDKEWAKCVWEKAPESAEAWIAMTPPTWQTDFQEKSSTLAHRILAICADTKADKLKPNRIPKWKSLSKRLSRSKPEQINSQARDSSETLRCSELLRDDDGAMRVFLVNLIRRSGGEETIIFQQYFDYIPQLDKVVRLPQGLRIIPPDDVETSTKCQTINPDGTLSDA